jgi:site-specific DNA-cytosine methylase
VLCFNLLACLISDQSRRNCKPGVIYAQLSMESLIGTIASSERKVRHAFACIDHVIHPRSHLVFINFRYSDVKKQFLCLIAKEQSELDKLESSNYESAGSSPRKRPAYNKKRKVIDIESGGDSDKNGSSEDDRSLSDGSSAVSFEPTNTFDATFSSSSEDSDVDQSTREDPFSSNENNRDTAALQDVRDIQELIELIDSSTDSDGELSDKSQLSSSAGDVVNEQLNFNRDADDNMEESEPEDDEEYLDEIKNYHERRIEQSRLAIAMQGFQRPQGDQSNNIAGAKSPRDEPVFDPTSVTYRGNTYLANRCYKVKNRDGNVCTIAIQRFTSKHTARCILVTKFEDTFLGIEEEDYEIDSTMQQIRVQVFKCVEDVHLSEFLNDQDDGQEIPELMYEPQRKGFWNTFGYFYDRNKPTKTARRKDLRTLELFAGAGGSLIGYCDEGFVTVLAVEKDSDAISTLKSNNPNVPVLQTCVKDFLRDYDRLHCLLGRIDHIHFSSPCQDFSRANRYQHSRRDRADLTLLLLDFVKKTSCATAAFENVEGIFSRNNISYLKKLSMGLIRLGYQMRCSILRACDYGDAQIRPRCVMLIAKNGVPIPTWPAKTHGLDPNLEPFVSVEDAFRGCLNDSANHPNMIGRVSNLEEGQHGVVRLHRSQVAPTIRCGGAIPLHFEEDRCITVREAACLQSIPLDYKISGNLTSKFLHVCS